MLPVALMLNKALFKRIAVALLIAAAETVLTASAKSKKKR